MVSSVQQEEVVKKYFVRRDQRLFVSLSIAATASVGGMQEQGGASSGGEG